VNEKLNLILTVIENLNDLKVLFTVDKQSQYIEDINDMERDLYWMYAGLSEYQV